MRRDMHGLKIFDIKDIDDTNCRHADSNFVNFTINMCDIKEHAESISDLSAVIRQHVKATK